MNALLYRRRDLFVPVGEQPPIWFLQSLSESPARTKTVPARSKYGPNLYAWQRDALTAWERNGRQGIVEAVTGAGKTKLGLTAIGEHVAQGGRAVALVPSLELLHQWKAQLDNELPGVQIGLLGGGNRETLADVQVLISTGQTACRYQLGLPAGVPGLLVADECHRYGAALAQNALEEKFAARLGLSATYERADYAHETVLLPYFDDVVFTLDYRRATDDCVVAPVRIALLGVKFSAIERAEYDEVSKRIRNAWTKLVKVFGVCPEPFGRFIAEVNDLAGTAGPEKGPARAYLKSWSQRRALMAQSRAKLNALGVLADSIRAADRSFVFTESKSSANRIARRLVNDSGIVAAAHHSDIDRDTRHEILKDFGAGRLKALATVRTLEEGVDVPEADLGIIMAASKQRRQMVQRMGRIMRLKEDGRAARFVIVYVTGTTEDPATGAHEDFLETLFEVAVATQQFSLSQERELTGFLDPTA